MKNRISIGKFSQGPAFGDYLGLEKQTRKRHFGGYERNSDIRFFLLPLFLILFLGILVLKLVKIQILEGQYYRNLSDNNRVRTTIIHAPRGIIFDKNHVPLVFNTPGFRELVNGKTIILSKEEALSQIAQGKKDLEIDSLREYPYKDAFAHVLGFTGQITSEELKKARFKDYRGGDLIGKDGTEKQYEEKLKGADGKQMVEVNAMGEKVRTLGTEDPVPGEDITLTLDLKLQQAVFSAMEKVKKGAVVVSTPKGEILAMVSKPSFDPNLFTLGKFYTSSTSAYKTVDQVLLDSENQPLLNRSIGGVYPPGSTFKIVTATSGLENNLIDQNYQVQDNGVLTVGAFSFGNWYFLQYGKTEGAVNVVKALQRSNDIFFYKLAELVGIDRLSKTASEFGFGKKEDIDLEGEEEGLVPTKEWKRKEIGEQWYLGDTYHYGIGQGFLLVTPLQVNVMTQVIASGGFVYKQHLLRSEEPLIKNTKFINEKSISLIRQGMIESCSIGGVAWPLFEFKVKNSKLKVDGKDILMIPLSSGSAEMRQVNIACKTGTAQHGTEETLPHAWITIFAPAFNPQIVITVLAESSGEGSNVAAPIAKKILEEWFSR